MNNNVIITIKFIHSFTILYVYYFQLFRKTEQDDSNEVSKIPKEDLGSDVKFISDEIKQDIDSMPVQIFHDLPGEGPFPIASPARGDVLIHDQTQPVFQPLAIEDPHNEVTHALEGIYIVQITFILLIPHQPMIICLSKATTHPGYPNQLSSQYTVINMSYYYF